MKLLLTIKNPTGPTQEKGSIQHQDILQLYLIHTDTGDSCWEWGASNLEVISSRTSEKWRQEAATEPWFSLGKFSRSICCKLGSSDCTDSNLPACSSLLIQDCQLQSPHCLDTSWAQAQTKEGLAGNASQIWGLLLCDLPSGESRKRK